IDEEFITKAIFPFPVDAVRLEGISAVGAKDDGASARVQYTDHFADGGAVVLDVFDHFVAEDQVERPGRKRDAFPGGVEDVWRVGPRFGGALEVVFQSDDGPAEGGEVFHVHADAAAVFED